MWNWQRVAKPSKRVTRQRGKKKKDPYRISQIFDICIRYRRNTPFPLYCCCCVCFIFLLRFSVYLPYCGMAYPLC